MYICICCSSYLLIGDHCSYFQTTGFSSIRPFSSLMAVTFIVQSIQRKVKATYYSAHAHGYRKKKEKSADDICRRDMPAYYIEIVARWRNSLLERMNYY